MDTNLIGSVMVRETNGDPSLVELLAWIISLSGLSYLWKKASK